MAPAPVVAPPIPTTHGPDQHAGSRELDAATQRDVLSELSPGMFDPAAPLPVGPVAAPPARIPWDGQSTNAAHVANRARLKRDITAALTAHLNGVMVGVRAEATRPRLPVASFEGPGRGAKSTADAVFGHLKAAAALSAAGRHGVTFTASGPGRNLFDANDPGDRAASGAPISAPSVAAWMAIHDPAASTIIQRHHFEPDAPGSESEAFLHGDILPPFVAARLADLRLYDLWGFALAPEGAGIGRTVATPTTLAAGLPTAAGAGRSALARGARDALERVADARARVHPHARAPAWDGAVSAGGGVMNEGFCEMFTAEILDAQIATAGNDAALRATVEGNATTPPPTPNILPASYTSPTTYQADRQHAENIRARIGSNSVRAAYFQGHIEFVGLLPGGAPAVPVTRRRPVHGPARRDDAGATGGGERVDRAGGPRGQPGRGVRRRAAAPDRAARRARSPDRRRDGRRHGRDRDAGADRHPERCLRGRPRPRQPGRRRLGAPGRRRPRPGAEALMSGPQRARRG